MLKQPDHVRAVTIGHGTTAVLNLRTGNWVWLDEDSRRIWATALAGGSAPRTLVDSLVRLGYDRQQVQKAVDATVARLREYGLVAEYRAPGRRPWWRVISWR
ncbi:PqqD family protein [Streptomyces prasinus]